MDKLTKCTGFAAPWRSTIQKSCNSFNAEEENRTTRYSNCTDTGKLRHFPRSHNTTAMQT